MRQRLGLAQALLGTPARAVAGRADHRPRSRAAPELLRHRGGAARRGRHRAAVLARLTELEGQTDRVAILDQGRLIALGNMSKLRSLARLPVRIRISVADRAEDLVRHLNGAGLGTRIANGHEADGLTVELTCDGDAKMEVLRRAVAFGPAVRDIEIAPPTLDELYARFLDRGAGGMTRLFIIAGQESP